MKELSEKKKKIEVALLRAKADRLHNKPYDTHAKIILLEADLLNIKADILEATPINTSTDKAWIDYSGDLKSVFDSFKDK